MIKRVRFHFSGVVQGVGFRPFIFRLAVQRGLAGFVQNRPDGVVAEVEGADRSIEEFIESVKTGLPPLADIASLASEEIAPSGETSFSILESEAAGEGDLHITPDIAICEDCLRELFDPTDLRYRYPFINCTNCGPRLTIIQDIPYDRGRTSMSCFEMCPECRAEYESPANRRFHAEPNACPRCGPRLTLLDADGSPVDAADPIEAACELLRAGKIAAVKGLGGFHLAVDASSDAAVKRLRGRKYREEKPLAIMVKDIEAARTIAGITPEEERLLLSPQRPIVFVEKKPVGLLSEAVAPGLGRLGIMLPYTPLHHLLLERNFAALVMTSGNQVDEPICIGNREAKKRLKGIADFFLVHNRDILVRCDDSVAFVAGRKPRVVRRSRGYAPKPILLAGDYPGVLALGPQLKGSICILKGRYAFLSPHIGDLETPQARDFFHQSLALMKELTETDPALVACDAHPGYYATRKAAELKGVELVFVQHHHAHIVSCMAENRIRGQVIGLAMDGTGYGTDGAAWGGEFLIADEASFRRAGQIGYFPLPGGEKAVREPWRIAAGLLRSAYGPGWNEIALKLRLIETAQRGEMVERMIARRINTSLSSGLGRIFDAVAALLGLRRSVTFEGQAAMELEALANRKVGAPLPYGIDRDPDGRRQIDFSPLVRAVVDGRLGGRDCALLASGFHQALQLAFAEIAEELRSETGINRVVLSGGCFQNKILLEGCMDILERKRFEVFTHQQVPTNDGGIALGQAVIAAARKREGLE